MRPVRPAGRRMWPVGCLAVLAVLGVWTLLAGSATAAPWPTYRHDGARSGVAGEALVPPLRPRWVFVAPHPPEPAWGDPQPKPVEGVLELPRLRFDDAYHPVSADGLVVFGSSADGQVYALDAATGAVRWRFPTEGPVRCAPTLADGRVYVGSDDGRVYCLDARSGRPVWTFRAALTPEKVLGNGRLISLWPVRTGVLVADGVAYFAAGVFPGEGLALYALDARTGAVRWKNDTWGLRGGRGVSPQGYLLVSAERVFVPSGRAMPAAFDRRTGRFLYQRNFSWRAVGLFGGTYTMVAGDLLWNGTEQIAAVSVQDGRLVVNEGRPAAEPSEGARRLIVTDQVLYLFTGKEAVAYRLAEWMPVQKELMRFRPRLVGLLARLRDQRARLRREPSDRLRKEVESLERQLAGLSPQKERLEKRLAGCTLWRVPCEAAEAVVLAGPTLVVGGRGRVLALAADSGREVWSAEVQGRARGLAVADGRLIVSTDAGRLYAFAASAGGDGKTAPAPPEPPVRTVRVEPTAKAFPPEADVQAAAETAAGMVKTFGLDRGYGLVLTAGAEADLWRGTALAAELARRTRLRLHLPVTDADRADALRRALAAAGLHGRGVTVHRVGAGPGGRGAALPFADYFADVVVVCPGGDGTTAPPASPEEVARLVKPCGGRLVVARPGSGGAPLPPGLKAWVAAVRGALEAEGEVRAESPEGGRWVVLRRGALRDVGAWTHEYADAGNTGASDEDRVRGPLGVLWFGRPGPGEMPNRHASAASPLAVGGRLFVQGENVVLAYDAYNGLELWRRQIPGAIRLGLKTRCSNLAARPDSLFVAVANRCLRLDAATGRTLRTYQAPKGKGSDAWRYVAVDGDRLFGSTEGGLIFAFDVGTGATLWTHQAERPMETTICLDGGRLFYVDRTVTERERETALAGIDPKKRVDYRGRPVPPDVRAVVALAADTGKPLWRRPVYVGDCVGISKGGGELTVMAARGVVLLCGQPWNGHFWGEFFAGRFSRRSLIALSAADGRDLWSGRRGYRSRPLIVGDTIYAEPWAYDLRTGEPRRRRHPITDAYGRWQMARPGHHCGNIVGCPHVLFFRSGSAGFYNLDADEGTAHFGGLRPGCWINCIPACGVVLMPEASSGCVCPFSLQCTVVFHHRRAKRTWAMASADGPVLPVRRLAVNLGGPGDRKDEGGTLWLAWPRPYKGRLVLAFDLRVEAEGGRPTWVDRGNPDFLEVPATPIPWLYATGVAVDRPLRLTIPLNDKDEEAGWTVRLHLTRPAAGDRPGALEVTVGGRKTVVRPDAKVPAGGAWVHEVAGVRAGKTLVVSLRPGGGAAGAGSGGGAPVLAGLEVVRE